MSGDVICNGRLQAFDAPKSFATDPLVGDFSKPTFYLIEPRGTGGRKMQMAAQVPPKPSRHFRGFVCRIVVQHDMDFQAGRHLPLDPIQKAQELLMAMPAMVLANDFARGDIQGRKQRGGSVPLITRKAEV